MTDLFDAARKIMGERLESYGPPDRMFERIADVWSEILQHHVSAYEVALMMATLKILRATTDPYPEDSLIDAACYLKFANDFSQE